MNDSIEEQFFANHLDRERSRLQAMVAPGEQVLELSLAGMGYFKPGLLAITNRRLIAVSSRRLLRGVKVIEVPWADFRSADVMMQLSYAGLVVRRSDRRRVLTFTNVGDFDRASELARRIRSAAGVHEFRSTRRTSE